MEKDHRADNSILLVLALCGTPNQLYETTNPSSLPLWVAGLGVLSAPSRFSIHR